MPNWSEEVLIISNIKNTIILLMISMVKKLLEHFMKKNCKRLIKNNLEQKKGDKLYVKWNGYDNSFNLWINKRDLV